MLPSLRPLIAEGMRDLATKPPRIPGFLTPDRDRLWAGASTLDWCEANDPDSDPCCGQSARVDELESAFEDVRAALITWRHAELKDEITEILLSLGL